jgi:hypothetical protein
MKKTAGENKEKPVSRPSRRAKGILPSPLVPPLPPSEPLDQDVALNVFSGSAAMVGVCLTCIGLLRIFSKLGNVSTLGDDLLAVDSFLFLAACMVSYIALRNRSTHRRHGAERLADGLFLGGLFVMALTCAVVVWTLL